jgi:hypothetical protein
MKPKKRLAMKARVEQLGIKMVQAHYSLEFEY